METTALVTSLETGVIESVRVAYSAKFTHGGKTLGSFRSDSAVFSRQGPIFVFDAGRSRSSKADIENLYEISIDHPSNEDFLRYILPALKKIATDPDGELKSWLRRFLESCDNTAEKRELQMLLTKAQR